VLALPLEHAQDVHVHFEYLVTFVMHCQFDLHRQRAVAVRAHRSHLVHLATAAFADPLNNLCKCARAQAGTRLLSNADE
jgi:hypothetical protein